MNKADIAVALADIQQKVQALIDALDDGAPVHDTIPTIDFKDHKDFAVPQDWLDEWYQRYGELFVRKELVNLSHWCKDNVAKQKYAGTGKGKPKSFIGGWLRRNAEKSGQFVGKAPVGNKYARKHGAKS